MTSSMAIEVGIKKQKSIENKKPEYFYSGFVVPPGIEPGTHGFSVHCSTI